MKRKPTLSEEDRDLFRRAVADVRPLQVDTVPPYRQRPRARPFARRQDPPDALADALSDAAEHPAVESEEVLAFARPGLQRKLLRRLRAGQLAAGAQLDLHGKTVAEAREALAGFLLAARSRGLRCVRIVHGKGNSSLLSRPVLKGKVSHWLRQRDEVLAFTSARPEDGGTGAVYVLLRRG